MREQEKRIDLINSKLEQIKSEMQSFSSSFLGSRIIKFLVDLCTNSILGITKSIDTFDVF